MLVMRSSGGCRCADLFTPRLAPAERALVYGVLGGMPVYLQRGNDRLGHRANLQRLFADPTSPLVEEGQYVPPSELAEASGYFRILHAIAVGERTCGAIKEYTRIDIAASWSGSSASDSWSRLFP